MKELNKILGIDTKLSTTYHPQTDGQTERMNQELEQYLRMFVDYCQMNWLEWLAIAKFSYNNKIQKSTKISPFYANYGFNPWMGFEPQWDVKVQAVDEFVNELKKIQEEAKAALCKACDDMKHFADWMCMHAPEYKEGDQVWLSTKNLNINWPLRKLTKRQIGPYTITHVISPNAVVLKLLPSFKIDAPINVSWLHPYKPPTTPGQQIMPQVPVKVEGEEEYIVEEILESHLRCKKLDFLVKWEGYTNGNNLWEPKDNCKNAHNAIPAFYQKYPQVPRWIAQMQFNNLNFQPYQNFTQPNVFMISHLEVKV